MSLGLLLHKLWRRRAAVACSLVIAAVAALWSVDRISILPPGLTPRAVEFASAHATAIVDTPTSVALDLRQSAYNFESLENRAILLGDLVATPPVANYIARAAGVPPQKIQVSLPATPDQPLPRVDVQHPRKTTDILRYNGQYRVSVEANPTAPTLDIYANAPKEEAAVRMANSAVAGLSAYIAAKQVVQGIPPQSRIHLRQAGGATGGIVDPGAQWQLAALAFVFALVACYGAFVLAGRVRRGWRLGRLSEGGSAS
jgi:hypothetical protein